MTQIAFRESRKIRFPRSQVALGNALVLVAGLPKRGTIFGRSVLAKASMVNPQGSATAGISAFPSATWERGDIWKSSVGTRIFPQRLAQ